jgi:regulator of protease activity HflC (stomatin/prohibitin superfamily)
MAQKFDTVNYIPAGGSTKNVVRLVAVILGLLILIWLSPFGTIAAGERGVHLRFGAVTGVVHGEGLYFRIPLIDSVQTMLRRICKRSTPSWL